MPYTYLITGATSDVGAALIRRVWKPGDIILAQGANDLDRLDGVRELPHTRVVGLPGVEGRAPIVSLDFGTLDNAEVAYTLDSRYGVMTRCGLHCAPRAHKSLGTFPQGTVRFAFGYGNTESEVDQCLDALKEITRQ